MWESIEYDELVVGNFVQCETYTYSQKYIEYNFTREGVLVYKDKNPYNSKIIDSYGSEIELCVMVGTSGDYCFKKQIIN